MRSVLGDRRAIAILLGPALTVYTLVMLVPMVWSLGYTFFTGNVIEGFSFNGFGNFAKLWHDPQTLSALGFTLKYAVVITICQVLLGYLLSLLYVFVLRRSSALSRAMARRWTFSAVASFSSPNPINSASLPSRVFTFSRRVVICRSVMEMALPP